GTLRLVRDVAEATGRLGVEPLAPEFTTPCLAALLDDRRAPVKSFLLNQALIAGIGNIYADEALFAARIDPRRAAGSLSSEEVTRLHAAIREVLCAGIRNRGVSFRDYRDAEGNAGGNQAYVRVFRRTGQPCDVCGTPIARIKVAGRSTHYCPQCQR
ncbi:MAG TPA: zinc finger domain-containing protein, partial [Dehalococcoidia bacterium]|nr:zinc finger domain-containing protein [Dehalococcoidia bacterium]